MPQEKKVSPWVLMKEGFLPTPARADIEIARRHASPQGMAEMADPAMPDWRQAPDIGAGAGLNDLQIAQKQAEIAAKYRAAAEARAAAQAAQAPPPEWQQQGYRPMPRRGR